MRHAAGAAGPSASRFRGLGRPPDLRLIRVCARAFPPLDAAQEDGLLCGGGDLRAERLLAGYALGVFPWYNDGMPIMWWSLDPRCILRVENFRLPSRSARAIRGRGFRLSLNTAFDQVIRACAAPRRYDGRDERKTWLTVSMIAAYERLHAMGYAHSLEAWLDGELAGGLYGVLLDGVFFGESMFHRCAEASRAALAGLVSLLRARGIGLIDSQQETPHMMAMGAECIPRSDYIEELRRLVAHPLEIAEPWHPWKERWTHDPDRGWIPEQDGEKQDRTDVERATREKTS